MQKTVHVAVGVIRRGEYIFISKRPNHLHQGGFWEFPGGKVEAGETVLQALARELQEEVGLQVLSAQSFMQLHYDYPQKTVFLDVFLVTECEGEGQGLEQQEIAWVHHQDLCHYSFPEANQPILTAVGDLFAR